MASASSSSSASISVTTQMDLDRLMKEIASMDLDRLIQEIDSVLSQKSPPAKICNFSDTIQPASADMAKFLEGFSEGAKMISDQKKLLSHLSAEAGKTAVSVLKGIGNLHVAAAGFLVVASVLERFEKISSNQEQCWNVLKRLNDLAKCLKELKDRSGLPSALDKKVDEAILYIFQGAMMCVAHMRSNPWYKFFLVSKNREDLINLAGDISHIHDNLNFLLNATNAVSTPTEFSPSRTALGIDDQVEKVIECLDFQSDKPAIAVVVCGIGGMGKTTITDAVFHRFHRLQGYKTCMVRLNEDVSQNRSIKELQAAVLEALTGRKYKIENSKFGQEEIKRTLHTTKETVLMYIDNVLRTEYVKEILPERVDSSDKFRLLLTARKRDVAETVESCGIEHCKVYEVKPLETNYCIEIICKNLDENRECNRMEKINHIAEKCSGIPLVLEVVGGYLGKAIRSKMQLDQTLDKVLQALEQGEPFSANSKDKEYQSKLMFAYNDLEESAKDAFLDISIFFCGRKWDEVDLIVGEEELRALEEGALVKRIADKTNVHDVLVGISRSKSKKLRITSTKELSHALQNQKITSEIKGIWLQNTKKLYSDLSAEMLDKMHRSLRVLALGNQTMIEGICKAKFDSLRFLQAGDVGHLPFDISMFAQLRVLDNDSGQHIGFNIPSQIPATLRVLRLCEKSYCEKFEISPQLVANLKYLRSLKLQEFASLFEMPQGLTQLTNLVKLDLSKCENLYQLPKRLGDLKSLQELNLTACRGLTQMPESIEKLQCLKTLSLEDCGNVKQLPAKFGSLSSLECLYLSSCKSLRELPESFCSLSSLQDLDLSYCESLQKLPESFGSLSSLQDLHLSYCESLQKLPESFGSLISLQDLDLSGCKSLQELPSSFDQLASLRELYFSNCNNLLHLPDDLGNLTSLVELNINATSLSRLPSSIGKLKSLTNKLRMWGCTQLKELPEEFCELNLEMLYLIDFFELERLPGRFMELTSLKHLSLTSCKSLVRLPEGFGTLPVLEELNLESCIKLQELSSDFDCLPSLKKLKLISCVELEGLWMNRVVKVNSLDFVDITGSCLLEHRWTELRKTEDSEILVNTDKDGDEDGRILKKAASLFFKDECSLFDCHGTPFKPSALEPNTMLVVFFEGWNISQDKWIQLMEKIQGFLKDCIDPQIIYAGNLYYESDASIQARMKELNGATLGLGWDHSKLRVAVDMLVSKVTGSKYESHVIMTSVVDKDGTKQFSEWKNVTNLLEEINIIPENYLRLKRLQEVPQDTNTEMLRSLLVTEGKDFLRLGNSKQVSIDSLQGKVVLLLVSRIQIDTEDVSALKEMYSTASGKHKIAIVWMPIYYHIGETRGEFVRAAESMPWPAMRDPFSIQPAALKVVKEDWKFQPWDPPMLVVVDEKGINSCKKNLKRIVERWGMEAYPFSADQIHKLRMAEWDQIKAKSTLEVLFENFDCFEQVKKSMLQGQLICIYGGDPWQISDFTSKLSSFAVSDAVQIICVGPSRFSNSVEVRHERNRPGMRWLSLSLVQSAKFWNRIEYLLEDLKAEGYPESLEKYRVSLGILKRNRWKENVWMTVVEESGEVVRAAEREEVVRKLPWWEKEGCEIVMQAITWAEEESESSSEE